MIKGPARGPSRADLFFFKDNGTDAMSFASIQLFLKKISIIVVAEKSGCLVFVI
jgi:hypothetical protein